MLNTNDYRNAPGGEGPHAEEWNDKPHRLIYDLCSEIENLRISIGKNTVFVCTHVHKTRMQDDVFDGIVLDTEEILMSNKLDIRNATLGSLIYLLGETFYLGLVPDRLTITSNDVDVTVIYQRTENQQGNIPSKQDYEWWQEEAQTLYQAFYTFTIQKVAILEITTDDVREAQEELTLIYEQDVNDHDYEGKYDDE